MVKFYYWAMLFLNFSKVMNSLYKIYKEYSDFPIGNFYHYNSRWNTVEPFNIRTVAFFRLNFWQFFAIFSKSTKNIEMLYISYERPEKCVFKSLRQRAWLPLKDSPAPDSEPRTFSTKIDALIARAHLYPISNIGSIFTF